MLIQRAYKTQLDPTARQEELLWRHLEVARFVWNWALARRNEHYAETGKHLSSRALIAEFRRRAKPREGESEWPWVLGVASRVEESAVQALDAAFDRYFRICRGELPRPRCRKPRKDGKPAGYPRFRSRHPGTMSVSFWSVRPEHVRADAIRLQKIGWVRLKERGYLPTSGVKINRATVSERAGRWFVSLQVEMEIPDERATGDVIGVDVGIEALATTSDGRRYENPRALEAAERQLRRLQRRLARQEKGSARRRRTKEQIARLHWNIACIRVHAAHDASADIVGRHRAPEERPSVIGVEALNVTGMLSNRRIARAASDAAMAELLRQVAYKAQWAGCRVQAADQWFASSKTCSHCGAYLADLSLSDRTYRCPKCGFTIGRDWNSALNLRAVAAESAETLNCARRAETEEAGAALRSHEEEAR